jgi:CheY-like chemotaxis protein
VLVAEDNEINQMVALGILAQLGYRAELATNGAEAVDAAARSGYAAILMDCHMPEIDGYEATARIRARERHDGRRPTPIVAMTAGVLTEDRDRALAAGMDDYVSKPVKPEELETVLRRWVPQDGHGAPSPEPPADSGEGVLDEDRIGMLRSLGPADGWGLFPGLVESFLAATPRLLETLAEAVAAADPEAVRYQAHRLRGSALTVGATALADACLVVEEMGRAGNLGGAGSAMARVGAEVTRASLALQDVLAGA